MKNIWGDLPTSLECLIMQTVEKKVFFFWNSVPNMHYFASLEMNSIYSSSELTHLSMTILTSHRKQKMIKCMYHENQGKRQG